MTDDEISTLKTNRGNSNKTCFYFQFGDTQNTTELEQMKEMKKFLKEQQERDTAQSKNQKSYVDPEDIEFENLPTKR